MAELVGVFAASHGPLVAREWDKLPDAPRQRLSRAYAEVGRRVAACRPDVLIAVSPDHWVNFFIDNLPAICIGLGEEHDGPPEPFMKPLFPHATLPGHAALGRHLLATALQQDFEPALSHRLTLDHGFCIPLWRMNLPVMPAILPIVVNDLEPPMLSIRRCLAWGRLLREAIASYPEPLRVAVLGTGGLSHSIGEPTMGAIDEGFDRDCIARFTSAPDAALAAGIEADLPRTGNGAHEVRDWVIAHGAAGSRGFELIDYFPCPEVYVGCAFAAWNLDQAA